MPLVDKIHEGILHFVGWLLLFFTVFFSSFNEMEIGLITFEKEFISKIDAVFVTTNFMKPIHIELR